jgi:hypothetical protein
VGLWRRWVRLWSRITARPGPPSTTGLVVHSHPAGGVVLRSMARTSRRPERPVVLGPAPLVRQGVVGVLHAAEQGIGSALVGVHSYTKPVERSPDLLRTGVRRNVEDLVQGVARHDASLPLRPGPRFLGKRVDGKYAGPAVRRSGTGRPARAVERRPSAGCPTGSPVEGDQSPALGVERRHASVEPLGEAVASQEAAEVPRTQGQAGASIVPQEWLGKGQGNLLTT